MSTGQIAFNYTLLSEEATTMLFALMRAPFSPYHLLTWGFTIENPCFLLRPRACGLVGIVLAIATVSRTTSGRLVVCEPDPLQQQELVV